MDFSKAIDLSKIGQNGDRDLDGLVHSQFSELLPSEDNAIQQAILDERNSAETVNDFHFAEDIDAYTNAVRRFAHRLESRLADTGFKAVVSVDMMDPDNFDMEGDDYNPTIIWHPKIDIIGRTDDDGKSEDHERRVHEVRNGLADGRVGHMNERGEWSDDPFARKVIG